MIARLSIWSLLVILLGCQSNEEVILFSSSKNGNSDIYTMAPDGSNVSAITSTDAEEWAPTWISSNKISFLRQRGDIIERVELDLNTNKERSLDHPPNCTLDDKNGLYSGNNDYELYSCNQDIFIFNQNQGAPINLTQNIEGVSRYPAWSANGESVLFTSNHLGSNDLYLIEIDSKAITPLTYSEANNERGDQSPDGSYLVYSSNQFSEDNQDILLKNLDTGEVENITNSTGNELIARFSSDGNTIYYGGNKDGNWELYSYQISTKTTKRLTNNDYFDGDPRTYKE